MTRYAAAALCFLCGFVVCANLSRLVTINPHYDSGYDKVAIALFMAIFAALWEAK